MNGDATTLSLQDSRVSAEWPPLGPNVTFTGFTDPTSGTCIDHVFVLEDMRVVQQATRADTRENGRFPSDHLPVLVDLKLD